MACVDVSRLDANSNCLSSVSVKNVRDEANMSDLTDIAKVISDMRRDVDALGDCKKMLASSDLIEAMLDLHREVASLSGKAIPDSTAELYFRGTPVIECEQLQDLEYAFVK